VAERRSTPKDLLLAAALFALAYFAAWTTRDRRLEGRLASDEPEWIAISILHWQQLVEGAPPAGADLDPASERSDNPWKQGVQRTTFGYMNPCLPKLVWGATLTAAGHTSASPQAFQVFHRDDPRAGRDAQSALLPAEPLARRVVLALSALSAVLLFFCARELVTGAAAWIAGSTAFVAWFATPLVHATGNYLRTDHFMLPFCLAGLLVALRRPSATLTWGLLLGVCCGLAVSSKLNGGLLCAATAGWAALATRREGARIGRAVLAIALAALLTLSLFYALNPRLWGEPLIGVHDILARWDKLMAYFQDELAPRTGVEVARTLGERASLFVRTSAGHGVLFGHAGSLLALSGLATLAWRAAHGCAQARSLLVFAVVFIAGTIAWLPLDWERFYLTAVPALVLLQVAPLAYLAQRGLAARRAEANL
jgi:4-amino-4-deoxy-L-arabinose transferase-like glycosyltransferase